jgi:hypothetical protein
MLRKGCRPQSFAAEAFVLCPAGATGLSPGFQPWESSTQSDAPLRGRQIERLNKVEVGSDGPMVARPNCPL